MRIALAVLASLLTACGPLSPEEELQPDGGPAVEQEVTLHEQHTRVRQPSSVVPDGIYEGPPLAFDAGH